MKVLVTGSTGFIGSHLLPRLSQRHEIVALAQDLRGDVTFGEPVDAVVHLAQSRRYRDPEGADDVRAVNVDGTRRLLDLASSIGAQVFVLASSGSVYVPRDEALSEDDPVEGATAYTASKLAAETLVAQHAGSLTTVVLRFFTVYGPGQRAMLVAELIDRVVAGKPVTVRNLRLSPTYVEDAARAIEASLSVDSQLVVNVAGDEHVSVAELVSEIEQATGRTAARELAGDEAVSLVGSNDKMKRVLGVAPEWTLQRGLAATVAARAR